VRIKRLLGNESLIERQPAETTGKEDDFRVLTDHPAHLIRRSYQVFLYAFDEAMAGLKLSPVSWIIIATTHSFPGLSVTEVARRAAVDKASCGRTASSLERRGLLRIKKSDTDQRQKLLDLTPAGELLYAKAFGRVERLRSLLLDDLALEEQHQLLTTLTVFLQATGKNTRPSIPAALESEMN